MNENEAKSAIKAAFKRLLNTVETRGQVYSYLCWSGASFEKWLQLEFCFHLQAVLDSDYAYSRQVYPELRKYDVTVWEGDDFLVAVELKHIGNWACGKTSLDRINQDIDKLAGVKGQENAPRRTFALAFGVIAKIESRDAADECKLLWMWDQLEDEKIGNRDGSDFLHGMAAHVRPDYKAQLLDHTFAVPPQKPFSMLGLGGVLTEV